jgi:hypothetical protein
LKELDTQYSVSIFGGEPLLNWNVNFYLLKELENFANCESIQITTNGDFLYEELPYVSPKLLWVITVYDLKDLNKLKTVADNKQVRLQATIEESNIEDIPFILSSFSRIKGSSTKITFSHSPASWLSLKNKGSYIYKRLYEILWNDLCYSCYDAEENKFDRTLILDNLLRRMLEFTIKNQFHQLTCISCNESFTRSVFYKGQWIGPCIRFYEYPWTTENHRVLPKITKRCLKCHYSIYCNKSCRAEWGRLGPPINLCLLQKVQMQVILDFTEQNKDNHGWQNLCARLISQMGVRL